MHTDPDAIGPPKSQPPPGENKATAKRGKNKGTGMGVLNSLRAGALAIGLACVAVPGLAAAPREVMRTDLVPLIDEAAKSPDQFAVNIPHHLTVTADGAWSVTESTAVWRYSIQIPKAVSISFHATRAALPANAILSVRAGSTVYSYRPRELRNGQLWSRIAKGDSLDLTLRVPASARAQVKFEISSFQAGYRGLGGVVANHPHYDQILQAASSTTNASCVANYACDVTANNQPAGQATVGLVIGNLYVCTGALLNDVPGDNTPYVLTARHCQTGKLGGGNPGAATSVTVYWDAITACGAALGTLYDPGIANQTGATTVVEQQDAWLIKLDESPVVADAYLAGFDASGADVLGGYSVTHSLGFDKQLTDWFGKADALQQSGVLGVIYLSDFLEVVSAAGNIGPGASGSAFFDQSNRLVGTLSLGRSSGDASGYESCPSPVPSPPNGSNGSADFTSLAAVWNSTADTTSTTGSSTLQAVLDPAATGTHVINSSAAAHLSLTALANSLPADTFDTLTWNAPGATTCTASGGVPGDGWTGSLASQSSKQISESSEAQVTYGINCLFPGARRASATMTVLWGSPTPRVSFTSPAALWTTRPAALVWSSNVAPCAISGGSLSANNLPSSGTLTTTETTAGDVGYTITCGPPDNFVTSGADVQYVTPSVQFRANGTDRLLGEQLILYWQSYADSCTPSGGAPNDGWSTTQYSDPSNAPSFVVATTILGTFTYTLNCSSGSISVQKQLIIEVENGAPFVTISADRTSSVFTGTPTDIIQFSWNSNLGSCVPGTTPLATNLEVSGGSEPQDTGNAAPLTPGVYGLTVQCFGLANVSATSTPIVLTVSPPPPPTATITITPSSVIQGQTFVLTFDSANTANCVGSTNSPDASFEPDWISGSENLVSEVPGSYTYTISCSSIDATQPAARAYATVAVTAAPPTVTVTATPASITNGEVFELAWSSAHAATCTGSGGGADGTNFSGPLPATSSTQDRNATHVGTFTYTVTCTSPIGTAHASASITVSSAAGSGGGSSGGNGSGSGSGSSTEGGRGGGGGGGPIDLIELLALGALVASRNRQYWRWRRRT
jgi:lysyl endopeptidase